MKDIMKIDLQRFAGDDNTDNNNNSDTNNNNNSNDSDNNSNTNNSNDNKNTDNNTKTFTQEELDKIIEKRLARALKKAEEEKAEAERLAKMSAEERAKEEFRKEKEKFEQERKQYQREKLELQVTKELATKELPTEFSKYLLGDNAESCMENIKTFETVWQKAIEKAVDAKLKGSTPKSGNSSATSYGIEDLEKLSMDEYIKARNKK